MRNTMHGEVVTYTLSPDELEKVRGGKVIHTKEEFLQLKASGMGLKDIQIKWGWTSEQIRAFITRHELGRQIRKAKSRS